MTMCRRLSGVFVALLLTVPATASGRDALDGFDAFVEAVMAEWQVPGMVVGAVRGGEVVVAKAYGSIDAEGTAPITDRTLFHLDTRINLP